MAIELLAATTSADQSASVTLGRGQRPDESRPVTFVADNLAGAETAALEISIDNGSSWIDTGQELTAGAPWLVVTGPGMYRLNKASTAGACGIFAATPGNP